MLWSNEQVGRHDVHLHQGRFVMPTVRKPKPTPGMRPGDYPDRVCDVLGCKTVLSFYNTLTMCWQHESENSERDRFGRRKRLEPGVA